MNSWCLEFQLLAILFPMVVSFHYFSCLLKLDKSGVFAN